MAITMENMICKMNSVCKELEWKEDWWSIMCFFKCEKDSKLAEERIPLITIPTTWRGLQLLPHIANYMCEVINTWRDPISGESFEFGNEFACESLYIN